MKQLLNIFVSTNSNHSTLIMRTILGIVLFAHGAQSALGWFGGFGFSNTMNYLTGAAGLPYIVAFSVILIQFLGSIMLIAGVLARPIALAIGTMFIGMILTVHIHHGFFMNWFGDKATEGYEYHLLVIALCVPVFIEGAGSVSVDRILTQRTSEA